MGCGVYEGGGRELLAMPELALLVGKKGCVFVRRAAQTDRAKERLFENAVQEQQKTLPLDRVVKNGCRGRGGIWRVVWMEGGANIPASSCNVPPLLPAAGHGCIVGEEDGGKHIEQRGKDRQTNKMSISEKDRQTERQKHE